MSDHEEQYDEKEITYILGHGESVTFALFRQSLLAYQSYYRLESGRWSGYVRSSNHVGDMGKSRGSAKSWESGESDFLRSCYEEMVEMR